MGGYVARRLAAAGLTLLALSFVIFILSSVAGDPTQQLATRGLPPGEQPTPEQIEAVRHEFSLDRPILVRYGRWLRDAAHGDLGQSLFTSFEVRGSIARALPATARLAVAALLLAVVLAVPAGIAGALFHRRWPDGLLRLVALAGASIPGFFLAYLLVFFAAVRLHLLPVAGMQGLRSAVLPALTLAVGPAAIVSRLLRTSLLEVLGETYIDTARGKGLAEAPVLVRHALRNGAIPILTVLGGILARLLEGAVIVEIIFAWPGIGRLTYDAVTSADYPVIQGTVLFAGVVFITLNLLVDLSYSLVDPQVRLGARG